MRSAAVPAFDTSIWRVLGNPLVGSESGSESDSESDSETGAPLHGLTVAVKDVYDVAGFAGGGAAFGGRWPARAVPGRAEVQRPGARGCRSGTGHRARVSHRVSTLRHPRNVQETSAA